MAAGAMSEEHRYCEHVLDVRSGEWLLVLEDDGETCASCGRGQ